jgi:hypothetical protein
MNWLEDPEDALVSRRPAVREIDAASVRDPVVWPIASRTHDAWDSLDFDAQTKMSHSSQWNMIRLMPDVEESPTLSGESPAQRVLYGSIHTLQPPP